MSLEAQQRLIVAYDRPTASLKDFEDLKSLVHLSGGVKFGHIAINAHLGNDVLAPTVAWSLVSRLRTILSFSTRRVFWDAKLLDIPKTVSSAVALLAHQHLWGLTVACSGDPKAIRAAVEARHGTRIFGVTVLTSMNDAESLAAYGHESLAQVLDFAELLVESGAQGIVCAPKEIEAVRDKVGRSLQIITPGVRLPEDDLSGQEKHRVATPREALAAGADYIVVGAPILQSKTQSPSAAAARYVADIARANSNRTMI